MGEFEALLGVNPWTALFALANFLFLFFMLRRFLFKPVMKMIDDRQKEIDGLYKDAEDAKKDAQAKQQEYDRKLSAAQQTSEQLVREAVARGQSREEEILRQANAQASAMMDKAADDIAREKKKAVNDAKDEISVIALSIAGKVVGRELNDADHARLVDGFIEELGEDK
ncbi:MAG: F0F1 ATP synthase subunit B [Firmicutes bacterium]|nr:F0F1 ATP synthase subunit B [Clostridiales bacterium]MDD6296702.1 F0F1 ATP synthase subunit B [Bacillota bacterium]MDD7341978.1 F0F1 ATP synthase subunit B [Bacillota bacterium]